MYRAILTAAAVAAATPAFAQTPVLEDPEANLVEELVIQAREPGPAWWKVSDADSTVYILGVGEALPRGMAWDRRFFDRRLKGANSLIVGTRISLTGGIKDVPALLKLRGQLRSKTPMEETLPPPLRERFVAARTRIGQPAGPYAKWTPVVAGQQLTGDALRASGATPVADLATKAAKKQKVKVVDPARYDALPFLRKAQASLTPALNERCLTLALDDIEVPAARTRAAAEGWAKGDVAAAVSAPRGFDKCLLILGGGAELWRRAVDDQADAVADALKVPGHSVALISLRPLLAEGGVIQRLEAKGIEVER
ncbi:MAG: TraB/GumN family protein [Pseudomonadota bacterium]